MIRGNPGMFSQEDPLDTTAQQRSKKETVFDALEWNETVDPLNSTLQFKPKFSSTPFTKEKPVKSQAKIPVKRQPKQDPRPETNEEAYDFVKYDPAERGCLREGLRVRRYARPWWITNPTFAVEFKPYTMEFFKLKDKFNQLEKNSGIKKDKRKVSMYDPIQDFLPPKEKIARLRASIVKAKAKKQSSVSDEEG